MKKINHRSGFSLIELMVASALFMTVVAVAAGAFISVLDASIQSREMNTLMSNLDFALEDISRNLRVGENYDIFNQEEITFSVYATDSSSEDKCQIQYWLSDGIVYKTKAGPVSCSGYNGVPITSSEIEVETLSFVGDQTNTTGLQPRININMSGVIKGDVEQTFVLQTSVTQRVLNDSN